MADYVLNSVTLIPIYDTIEAASADVAQLLRGLAVLDSDSEVLPAFRLPNDPWAIDLAQDANATRNISFGEIAHRFYGTIHHDYASFFDQLNRTVPSDKGLTEASIEELLRLKPEYPAAGYEATFASAQASALDGVMCAATSSILVSLPRSEMWNFHRMGFVCEGRTFQFDHLSNHSHAFEIRARRVDLLRRELTSRNFWETREDAFTHLLFGRDVKAQIEKFSATLLPLLFTRLAELDAKALKWKESNRKELPDIPPAIVPESKATMSRFRHDRNFSGSDGVMRTFEEHVWVDRTHRIHIFLHSDTKTIEVGYVGYHLPISSKPT